MSKKVQTNQERTVNLPLLQTRAAFVENSFNAADRTIEVVWTTGARGARYSWSIGKYYEELSLDPAHVNLARLNLGASVLNAHQSYDLSDVIGAVVPGTATVDGKEGRATVKFSERDEIAGYVKDVEAGIIRHISVGYNVTEYTLIDKIQEGDDLIPVYRATAWEPAELSFVPIAFDAKAQARSGSEKGAPDASGVPCVFINRGAAAEQGGNTMTEEEMRAAEAAKAEEARKAKEATDKARAEGAASLRQLMGDVRAAVAVLPEAQRAAVETELLADVGMTADKARAAVIAKLSENQPATRNTNSVQTVEDEADKFREGASQWLIQRSGVAGKIGDAGKNLQPGEFRGMRLLDLARMSLERSGVSVRGLDPMTIIGRAMTHRSGMNTTSDFAVLLENVMNKILQGAYAVTADTWRRFCATGSVSDFRAHNRYMMGTFGSLDSKNEAGEFKRKQIPDGAKESVSIGTKGNTIAISRETIVNDDMNALSNLGFMFGRAAKLSIEKDVYGFLALNAGLGGVLEDGKSIFHADHKNVGVAAAISVASVDADRVLMGQQSDISGNEILDLRPSILLISSGLGGTAKVINGAQYDPDTANKLQRPNIVNGLYSDIVDTARLAGTRRYSFADPSVAPVIEVAFLDGAQEPVLETKDGWSVDGTEMKVRIDYGVNAVGYHGAVTNAGA